MINTVIRDKLRDFEAYNFGKSDGLDIFDKNLVALLIKVCSWEDEGLVLSFR